ncbi:MAG: ComEA family DNA-binding protein [Clostridia bacterium]
MTIKVLGRELQISKITIALLIIIVILSFALYNALQKNVGNEKSNSMQLVSSPQMTQSPKVTPQNMIKAYICGEVKRPGVYAMQAGTIVFEAIKIAGGLTHNASKRFNLAWKIDQNLMLFVPRKNNNSSTPVITTGIDFNNLPDEQLESSTPVKVNLNTATLTQLMELPGVGESTANKIISYRKSNRFQKTEDIMNVSGIGEKKYEDLKKYIEI